MNALNFLGMVVHLCLYHFVGGYWTNNEWVVQSLFPYHSDAFARGSLAEGDGPPARSAFTDGIVFVENDFFHLFHGDSIGGDVLDISLRIVLHVPCDDGINYPNTEEKG